MKHNVIDTLEDVFKKNHLVCRFHYPLPPMYIQLELPLQKHGEIGLPKNFIEIKLQNISNPNKNGSGQQ